MKLFIVTMQTGPDFFKELIWANDIADAEFAAGMKFGCKCVNCRRAACHPGR